MIAGKKKLIFVMLLITSIPLRVYCRQERQVEHNVRFEVSPVHKWYHGGHRAAYQPKPKFVAVLFTRHAIVIKDFRRTLRSVFSDSVSQAQREFNEKFEFLTSGNLPDFVQRRVDSLACCLHAVSEEDAKAMVLSLLRWRDSQAKAELDDVKNTLESVRSQKPIVETTISRLREQMESLLRQRKEMEGKLYYDGVSDAQESIREFKQALRLVEVDIVGIRAKLNMIRLQKEKIKKEEKSTYDKVSDTLFQTRLTQEIELAGALAKQEAIQSMVKEASDYVSVLWEQTDLDEKIREAKGSLQDTLKKIANLEAKLADPPHTMRPAELADDKVVIYPVVWERDER
ncbi:MAG: hypothetical protein ACYS0C_09160 [Planctomycetota bacterium]|jgi:hypothetical protein